MSKFILAFKRMINLLRLTSPSNEEVSSLGNDEAIMFAVEDENGNISLNTITNDGTVVEVAVGRQVQ
jgi:hypothetical protein